METYRRHQGLSGHDQRPRLSILNSVDFHCIASPGIALTRTRSSGGVSNKPDGPFKIRITSSKGVGRKACRLAEARPHASSEHIEILNKSFLEALAVDAR